MESTSEARATTAPVTLVLGGRRIDDRVLAVATGLLATVVLVRLGFTGRGLVGVALASVLVVLAAIDLEEHRIPNRIVLPAAACILVANIAISPDRAVEWALAGLGAGLLLLLPLLAYPAGMGMGDVKLAVLLGVGLGADVVTALLLGFLAVVPVGLALLVRRGMAARKTAIPLAPFLAAGAVAVVLAG